MNVKELIALLETCPPDAVVTVWDAYHDKEVFDVHVSTGVEKYIHIGDSVFGDEIRAPS